MARRGFMRICQMLAFCLLSLSIYQYGPETLTGPGYLLVIVFGELVDRNTRSVYMLRNIYALMARQHGGRKGDK
jgi:hypothetical protein